MTIQAEPTRGGPQPTPGVLAAAVGDELVLWNPYDRTSHVLNRTARDVWTSLDGSRSIDDVVAGLADAYAVAPSTVHASTVELLGALEGAGLVDGGAGPLPVPVWPEALPPLSRLDAAHERAVSRHAWRTATGVHAAFAFHFALYDETTLTDIALAPTFAPLAVSPTGGRPVHRYTIRTHGGRTALALDGHALHSGSPSSVARHLIWHVNRLAVASVPQRVVVHAAAVQQSGRTLLLPGSTGSGKSTLTAALVARGWDYLSDESVAIDPTEGVLLPYPRSISLKRGSWPMLGELRPADDELASGRLLGGWHVSPRSLRPTAIGRPDAVHAVVFPHYRAGAAATLDPMPTVEALTALLAQSFDFGAVGQPGLDRLAALATGPVYRLDLDDLDEADAVLRALVRRSGASG